MSPKGGGLDGQNWLTEHLERLDQLRNARARDSAFKQWRQSALTVAQRLWPNDSERADRFRRIPFTPPGSRANERELRDAYESGCREARKLLKMWIAEVQLSGVDETQAAAAAAPPKIATKDTKPSLKSMLDLDGPAGSDAAPGSEIPEVPGLQPKVPRAPTAPVARALSALVYELPRLGIPAENIEFLRGALLDIANRLEFDEVKWATLQELVFLAMQHPALGRRILPLIIPYLDQAA